MAEAMAATARDARPMHKVPDPFPLTLAGMMAMLGPQAINFGISVGGGEAYLLPSIGARGTFHMRGTIGYGSPTIARLWVDR